MLKRYFALHAANLLGALQRIFRQPVGGMLTMMVIAIAIALPAGLHVIVNNADLLSGSWESAADFTVYLKLDVSTEEGGKLADEVRSRDDVADVAFVSRDDALDEFRVRSGFGDALEALDENPLPHALVVRPAGGAAAAIEPLARALDELPETDFVQVDTE